MGAIFATTEINEEIGKEKRLTSEEFIQGVLRTESQQNHIDNIAPRLIHAVTGISTEAGEMLDSLKKAMFYGKPVDVVNMLEELGDLQYYIGLACAVYGWSFEDLWESNQKKLKTRYPEKFAQDKALNRNLDAERAVLEGRPVQVDDCGMVEDVSENSVDNTKWGYNTTIAKDMFERSGPPTDIKLDKDGAYRAPEPPKTNTTHADVSV